MGTDSQSTCLWRAWALLQAETRQYTVLMIERVVRKVHGGGVSDSVDTERCEVFLKLSFGVSYKMWMLVSMQQEDTVCYLLITCCPRFAAAALCSLCHPFVHKAVQIHRHRSSFRTAPHGTRSRCIRRVESFSVTCAKEACVMAWKARAVFRKSNRIISDLPTVGTSRGLRHGSA